MGSGPTGGGSTAGGSGGLVMATFEETAKQAEDAKVVAEQAAREKVRDKEKAVMRRLLRQSVKVPRKIRLD